MATLNKEIADKFKRALIENGYAGLQLNLLMAQAAHETNGFNHKLALTNNNYAGIKYRNSLSKIADPSDDYFAPSKEDKGRRVPYARFKDIHDFVKQWIPFAHLNHTVFENKLGAPLAAASLPDFAHRLKLNHYYQASESTYLNGLNTWSAILHQSGLLATSSQRPDSLKTLPLSTGLHGLEPLKGLSLNSEQKTQRKVLGESEVPRQPMSFGRIADQGKTKSHLVGGRVVFDSNHLSVSEPATLRRSIASAVELRKYMGANEVTVSSRLPSAVINQKAPVISETYGLRDSGKLLGFQVIDRLVVPGKAGSNRSMATIPSEQTPRIVLKRSPAHVKNVSGTNTVSEESRGGKISMSVSDTHLQPRSINWDRDAFFTGGSNEYLSKGRKHTADAAEETSKNVSIHLNESLIGNFTIAVSNTAEAVDGLRQKIEEVLLEVVDSTNSIQ